MSYEVIDNFLDNDTFTAVKNTLLGDKFPWYLNNYVNTIEENKNINDYQLVHTFYKNHVVNSNYYSAIEPIINKINPISLIRVKANLLPGTENIIEHGWHTDFDFECITSVFYINTNNGYTIFKNGEKIKSIENRLVLFNSRLEHSGSTCTDEKIRCVVNINFI